MARRFTHNIVSAIDEVDALFRDRPIGVARRMRCSVCEVDVRLTQASARRWFLEHRPCGEAIGIRPRAGSDLAEIAWDLVTEGEIEPEDALRYIIAPTPELLGLVGRRSTRRDDRGGPKGPLDLSLQSGSSPVPPLPSHRFALPLGAGGFLPRGEISVGRTRPGSVAAADP